MALNPFLTDQFAAEIRDMQHHDRCIIPDLAPQLIERLKRQLPDVDERLLGEILLHTADVAGSTVLLLHRRGLPDDRIAPNTLLALAEAGSRLYRTS